MARRTAPRAAARGSHGHTRPLSWTPRPIRRYAGRMPTAPLSALRAALLQALGWTLLGGCTERVLADSATDGGSSSAPAGTTTAPTTTTTGGPGTPPVTTSASTEGPPDPTTAAASSTGAPGGTTGGTGSTGAPDGTTGSSSGDDSTTGEACLWPWEFGTQLMPDEVMDSPGCVYDETEVLCGGYLRICGPLPDGAESCDACGPLCVELPALCEGLSVDVTCGPFLFEGQCCHLHAFSVPCGDGRPFLVDGAARVAPADARADWLASGACSIEHAPQNTPALLDELGADARAELARRWTADGLAEHASVASFARFVLQLMSLGAPASLLADACAAQADEVRHAQICFTLAAAYAGAPVGPAALPVAGALGGPFDLEAVLAAVIAEGCIGETIAAAELDLAARTCADRQVAACLRELAADEQRHAALAWRTVQWALGRGDARLRRVAAAAFAVRPALPAEPTDPRLRRHGRLPAPERAALAEQCLRAVIGPCAAALLAEPRSAVTVASVA